MGATAGHEIEHYDISNIQLSQDGNSEKGISQYDKAWKKIPYQVSLKILEEEYEMLTEVEKESFDNFMKK